MRFRYMYTDALSSEEVQGEGPDGDAKTEADGKSGIVSKMKLSRLLSKFSTPLKSTE